ncbi:hypothetical protein ON058_06300 [Demequina sp. B12]|uniref:hypothetical protein n=1 Tax=Demequina sp. B12 TaxID=2992757 RepID=UPI00237B7162|nr:hypothetical protein [Demequina sp. B12]MDE0573020.1 hypothetical protein [Demequina sp. B12]
MTVAIAVLVVVAAAAISAIAGAPLIGLMLRAVQPGVEMRGLLRGGMWIGILERIIVTVSIAVGEPAAVAVVVAIKGLGRYPELRATKPDERADASERFIIGTLASLVWASALGIAARLMVQAWVL